jgi:WD40 repeat protein
VSRGRFLPGKEAWIMRLLVCALALALPVLAPAAPLRIGGDDGFRVGQSFTSAVLSPDGRFFAVAGERGGFHVLDAGTGQVVQSWDHCAPVRDLTFDRAGRLLVLDRAGWMRTYDPVHGQCLRELLLTDPGELELPRSSFLPGGHFVEICWRAGRERPSALHETTAGQVVPWVGDLDSNDHVTCSPDGTRLAVVRGRPSAFPVLGSNPRSLQVIDLKTGKVIARWSSPREEEVFDPAFRPDGRELFVVLGTQPTLFDLATGQSRALRLDDWEGGFENPTWSPDGRRLVLCRRSRDYGGHGTRIREWDVATGRLLCQEYHTPGDLGTIGYGPTGRLLAWNSSGLRLEVHAVGAPRPATTAIGHVDGLCHLAFDGNALLTLDKAGILCRWDKRTGDLLTRATLPKKLSLNCRIGPGGRVLLASEHHFAHFDSVQQRLGPENRVPATPDALSSDGRWFLDWDTGRGRVFDTEHSRTIWLPPDEKLWPHGRDHHPAAVWSADGRWLALYRRFVLADAPRLEIVFLKLPIAHIVSRVLVESSAGAGIEPELTPDGTLLLLATSSGIDAYETATGRLRRRYEPPADGQICPLASSPDSRFLFVAVQRRDAERRIELHLIELATGTIRRTYPWLPGMAFQIPPCFSPDGRWIACALTDATILLLPTDSAATSPTDPATIWRDLASSDAAVAGAAVVAVTGQPDAEQWVRDRIADLLPEIAEPELPALFWLAELEHDDPARREAARRKLARRPDLLPELEATLTGTPSPELRRALTELRDDLQQLPHFTPDALRRLRLAEALDRVARP